MQWSVSKDSHYRMDDHYWVPRRASHNADKSVACDCSHNTGGWVLLVSPSASTNQVSSIFCFFSRGRHHFVSVMFWWFKGGDVHRGNREPCTTNRLGLKLTHWLRWWPWKRPRFGLPSVVRLDLWPLVIWKQFSFGSKVRQFVGKHHMICSISVLLPFQVAAVCGSKFVSLKTPNGYFIKCPPQIHETVCLKGGIKDIPGDDITIWGVPLNWYHWSTISFKTWG